jgi:hypothetical protein
VLVLLAWRSQENDLNYSATPAHIPIGVLSLFDKYISIKKLKAKNTKMLEQPQDPIGKS